jgi:hypothetical protein
MSSSKSAQVQHAGWVWQPASRLRDEDPISVEDFYAILPQGNYLYRPTREFWPGSSVNQRVPPVVVRGPDGKEHKIPAAAWLGLERSVEQLTWSPGRDEVIRHVHLQDGGWIPRPGGATYNLYRPPLLGPEAGDPTRADAWVDHLRLLFGTNHTEHLIKWFAHRVQRPGEKLNHGLVLWGDQGIGKDTALVPVIQAVGPWNAPPITPTMFMGRFNGFVRSVILVINEGRDLGGGDQDGGGSVSRYSLYEKLKSVTCSPPEVLRVDEKHLRAFLVPNLTAVIVTTNHTNGLYLPQDDRRFFVAESRVRRAELGPEYFNRLWAWYVAGGIGHVTAYLHTVDLSDFNPNAPPPKTRGWEQMVAAGKVPENTELVDVLERLRYPEAVTVEQITRLLPVEMAEHWRDVRQRRQVPHWMAEVGYEVTRSPQAKDGLWRVPDEMGKRRSVVIYVQRELSVGDQQRAARKLVG